MVRIIASLAVGILLALPIFVFFYDTLVLGFLGSQNYADPEDITKTNITQGQSTVIFFLMFGMLLVGAVLGSTYERYVNVDPKDFDVEAVMEESKYLHA